MLHEFIVLELINSNGMNMKYKSNQIKLRSVPLITVDIFIHWWVSSDATPRHRNCSDKERFLTPHKNHFCKNDGAYGTAKVYFSMTPRNVSSQINFMCFHRVSAMVTDPTHSFWFPQYLKIYWVSLGSIPKSWKASRWSANFFYHQPLGGPWEASV